MWTQTLQEFDNKRASIREVVKAIKSERCVHEINAKQANGAVFVLCHDNVPFDRPCSSCKHPVVVKLSKSAIYEGAGGVQQNEVRVFREIKEAEKLLKGRWRIYRNHILQYVNDYTQGSENVIVSQYVSPANGGVIRNLHDFIKSGKCTPRDIEIIVIEIFMTLFVLRDIVPGFVHMDLLAAQIFLTANDSLDSLPINKNSNFVFGPRSYRPVIGDFGTTVTNMHRESIDDYKFYNDIVDIFQDVFRFFADIYSLAKGRTIEKTISSMIQHIFRGTFSKLSSIARQDPNNYLSLKATSIMKQVGLKSYIDVIERLPYLNKYLQKST